MRSIILSSYLILAGFATTEMLAQQVDMVDPSLMSTARIKQFHPKPHDLTNGQAHSRFGIFGIDSIPNFNDQFFSDGFDYNGNPNRHWYTNTVGNPPQMGGTTVIHAPIQPVNVELDDVNGNVRVVNGHPLISAASQLVAPVLASPVFSGSFYSSGSTPTQFSDAIQRAQYYSNMKPDWHTLLGPAPQAAVTMHIRQSATCPTGPGGAGCNYLFALNPDGTCCRFILVNDDQPNFTFEVVFGSIVANDIVNGVITTKDISTFLFPDVYVYVGNTANCCIVGFHTYFFQPGTDPEKRWIVNFSSWVGSGAFGPNFLDIAALSHEIAETYNDPFVVTDAVHDLTPFWLSPAGDCGDVLETGDPVESLPNVAYPVWMNGALYHPQNQALIQWFRFESPSSALGGAYSYPNPALLPQISAPQKFNCGR